MVLYLYTSYLYERFKIQVLREMQASVLKKLWSSENHYLIFCLPNTIVNGSLCK
jgi:hypothetical protein